MSIEIPNGQDYTVTTMKNVSSTEVETRVHSTTTSTTTVGQPNQTGVRDSLHQSTVVSTLPHQGVKDSRIYRTTCRTHSGLSRADLNPTGSQVHDQGPSGLRDRPRPSCESTTLNLSYRVLTPPTQKSSRDPVSILQAHTRPVDTTPGK